MGVSTIKVRVQSPDGDSRDIKIDQYPCRIGRQKQCTVQLSSWRVAKLHATIVRDGDYLVLVDQGSFSGTWIDGNRIVEHGPLTPSEEIEISGFRLRVLPDQDAAADVMPLEKGGVAAAPVLPQHDSAPLTPVHAAGAVNQQPPQERSPGNGQVTVHLRRLLHQLLVDSMDLRRQEIRHLNSDHLRARARSHLQGLLAGDIRPAGLKGVPPEVFEDPAYCGELIEMVLDEAVGLGVLERLLKDTEISEIMVNGCTTVFTERAGRLEDTGLQFSSDEAILAVIERIVSPLGRRIDEASPMVDARLPDGSRVNAVIPPLSVNGPCITIRRFGTRHFSPTELVQRQSLSADMLAFLTWCVQSRLNVVVSGGTGSGKTTLLNLLSQFIDPRERVITIED
jgi:pilus assembly protein CpaF